MTSYEKFFLKLKESLKDDSFEIWPDFEPERDLEEFSIIKMKGLGKILMLNCASCDGPSDLRHSVCAECARTRREYTKQKSKTEVNTVFLGRFYSLNE